MYLLPIFSSKDIVAQLPEEGILFTEVDSTFRKAMQSVAREPRVRETAGSVSTTICVYKLPWVLKTRVKSQGVFNVGFMLF